MKHTHMNSKNHQLGFTLVEVLVGSFLTLIVMGMLFAVLMGTIDAWEGGTSRLKSAGDARLALDILKTDLESLVARQTQYNQEWLVSTPITEDGVTATWLMFLAPSLDRDEGQEGDIVALSYRLAFQDPISTADRDEDKIFGLYKSMTTTVEAFNNVLGLSNIFTEYWDKGNVADPAPKDRTGFLAPNIVGFDVAWWVTYIASGSEKYERFDSTHSVTLSNSLRIYNSGGTEIVSNGHIDAVDVTLTSISDEGMRRFTFLENNVAELPAIIKEFGRTHTMRIPINY